VHDRHFAHKTPPLGTSSTVSKLIEAACSFPNETNNRSSAQVIANPASATYSPVALRGLLLVAFSLGPPQPPASFLNCLSQSQSMTLGSLKKVCIGLTPVQ
jgi:hypothetical protein